MKRLFIVLTCLFVAAPVWGIAADNSETTIILNTKTLIYHAPNCTHAKRCTQNCVKTTLEKAKKTSGRACKVCRGKISGK